MRLTVLAGQGMSTNILLNWLNDQGFQDIEVILEDTVPRHVLLRHRFRRLGAWTTFGQVLFQLICIPLLHYMSVGRRREIMLQHGLRDDEPENMLKFNVTSINSDETVEMLQKKKPDVVLVNGTRIIRDHVLKCVDCPFLNTHVGITPAYRGVHGGYWALWRNDEANFGVTIHSVDEGVDTGEVAAQVRTSPTRQDNFVTYPLLQQAASFPALKALLNGQEGFSGFRKSSLAASQAIGYQWYHPTIWQYVSALFRGVR